MVSALHSNETRLAFHGKDPVYRKEGISLVVVELQLDPRNESETEGEEER